MSLLGKFVFLENKEKQTLTGEVIAENDKNVTINTVDGEEIQVKTATVKEMDPSEFKGVRDLITLSVLDEAAIFHSLWARFHLNQIYTYCGNILVSVNPFKMIDDLYTLETAKSYYNAEFGSKDPHIFAIANECYSSLGRDQRSQCVVISGESGAGKTEATKLILLFLTTVTAQTSDVQEQIISASPILEAFGNAKTVRNDNSSRFGKFLKVHFNSSGQIVGASTKQYLLEKSRLVSQNKEERNYHIFYQILQGASDELRDKLKLTKPEDYAYLAGSTISIPRVDDAENFREVTRAMEMLYFGNAKDQIIQVLAAILHVGNLSFAVNDKEVLYIKNTDTLGLVASLIGLPAAEFGKIIITRTTITRGEVFETPLTKEQAAESKDAVAKFLYDSLFSFIVEFINLTTSSKGLSNTYIGILDIFGFENFEKNSFEQFCINFANERLQFFFNQHIFKMEQEEYKKEGISWANVDFVDNTPCIELISKKPIGLLAILDEESNFPKGTDASLLTKLHQQFGSGAGESKYYVKPKQKAAVFSIVHYAGEVQYLIESFIDKNKDTLRQEIMDLFATSKIEIIQQLFTNTEIPSNYETDKGITIKNATTRLRATKTAGTDKKQGAQKKATLGTQFNLSLGELMDTLGQCNPYFVRCVKPNQKKVSDRIDRKVVLDQLQYSGMLATVKVRKAGFPMRIPFTEFNKRYGLLLGAAQMKKMAKPKDAVEALLKLISGDPKFNKNLFAIGGTKLFMKQEVQNILERFRANKFGIYAVKIQAAWRGFRQWKTYKRELYLISRIQNRMRIFIRKLRFKRKMRAALKIQKVYKGFRQRKKYKVLVKDYRIQMKQKAEEEKQRILLEEQAKLAELSKFAAQLPPAIMNMDISEPVEYSGVPPPPVFFVEGQMPDDMGGNEIGRSQLLGDDDGRVSDVALPDEIQDILDDLNDIFDDSGATAEQRRKSSVALDPNLAKFIPKGSKDGQHINYQLPELIRKRVNNSVRILGFGEIVPVVRVETHITKVRKDLIPDAHALQKIANVFFINPTDVEYSMRKLNKSLLKLDDNLNLVALRLNKTLLKMTHENIEPKVFFHCMWYMAEEIRANALLKDEMICQIWKQINKCSNDDAADKTWTIFALFLQNYVPHATIKQGLISYLLTVEDEIARICLESLCRAKSDDRISPFVGIEWIAANNGQLVAVPVESANGENFAIGLDGLASCKEIASAFGNFFGLNAEDMSGYGVDIELDGKIVAADNAELLLDIIGKVEKDKNGVDQNYYIGADKVLDEEGLSDLDSKSDFDQSNAGSLQDIKPLKSAK